MKNFYKLSILTVFAGLALQSCYDEKMEWYNPHTAISKSEIPLLVSTQIKNCDVLKSYLDESSSMKLGVGVVGTSYTEDNDYATVVSYNFNSIEPTTEFALCNVITDTKGTYNYDTPDALYNAAVKNNMNVFGHSLISNQYQNVDYLNNQIADKVTAEDDKNYINVAHDNEYNFSYSADPSEYQSYDGSEGQGWTCENAIGYGDDYVAASTPVTISTDVDFASTTDKGALWISTQDWSHSDNPSEVAEAVSSYIPVPSGSKLNFSFYVKGMNRSLPVETMKMKVMMLGVKGGSKLYPAAGASSATVEYTVTDDWTQITYKNLEVDGSCMTQGEKPVAAVRIAFDVTNSPNSDIYFDNLYLTVGSGSSTVTGTNYIANSYFDGNEGIYNWNIITNRSEKGTIAKATAKNGNDDSPSSGYCIKVSNPEKYNSAGDFKVNALFADGKTLTVGQRYRLTFYARSSVNNAIVEFSTSDKYMSKIPTNSQAPEDGKQEFALSTSWEKQVWEFTALTSDIGSMDFKFAKTVADYYLDDVTLCAISSSTSAKQTRTPNYVSSYDESMKSAILENVMNTYITNMMTRYDKIEAWDVLQHAVPDSPTTSSTSYLSSTGLSVGNGEFYWGDYMKEDFIYKPFIIARGVNSNAKLFLSESNLLNNEAKLNALAQYVSKLQSYNGKNYIDGLSLEIHIVCSTDVHVQAEIKRQIEEMFTNINNKFCTSSTFLIRIGELDVTIESDYEPSDAQLAAQAEIYEHVVKCYRNIVNSRNQYGIYFWKLTDAEAEQNVAKYHYRSLFDADLQRKHAYLGVCNGLTDTGTTTSY